VLRIYWLARVVLVSYPSHLRLPARNGLVNKVEFLGLIPQNCGRPMRLWELIITYTFLTTLKYIHLHLSIHTFLSGFSANYLLSQKSVLTQEIGLGSPDHFSSWESGVCGWD